MKELNFFCYIVQARADEHDRLGQKSRERSTMDWSDKLDRKDARERDMCTKNGRKKLDLLDKVIIACFLSC